MKPRARYLILALLPIGLLFGGREIRSRVRDRDQHLALAAGHGSSLPSIPPAVGAWVPLAGNAAPSRIAIDAGVTGGTQKRVEWLANCGVSNDAGRPACFECFRDDECPQGQACGIDRVSGHKRCVSQDCTREEDCPSEWSCVAIGDQRTIRRCVQHGSVRIGDACSYDPASRDFSCEEGSICLANRCAVPCPNGACGAGETCVPSPDGPACVKPPPSCATTGCEKGETCVKTGIDTDYCASKVNGPNCYVEPCSKGYVCEKAIGGSEVQF